MFSTDYCPVEPLRVCTNQKARRIAESTATRVIQTAILYAETAESRTNPTRALFKTETNNVSGRCASVDRTCSAYTASLIFAERTGSFHPI